MRFLAPEEFPNYVFPLPEVDRLDILQAAHDWLVQWGPIGSGIPSTILQVLVWEMSVNIADVFKTTLYEAHAEFITARADEETPEHFRGAWASTMVSTIFGRVPWVTAAYMLDCYMDFEQSDGRPKPWEEQERLCNYMAEKAIRAYVSDRLPGQALAFFGIVTADFAGIGQPGYRPPSRPREVKPAAAIKRVPLDDGLDDDLLYILSID